jgi:hypothetical protein
MQPGDKLVVFSSFTRFLDLARGAVTCALLEGEQECSVGSAAAVKEPHVADICLETEALGSTSSGGRRTRGLCKTYTEVSSDEDDVEDQVEDDVGSIGGGSPERGTKRKRQGIVVGDCEAGSSKDTKPANPKRQKKLQSETPVAAADVGDDDYVQPADTETEMDADLLAEPVSGGGRGAATASSSMAFVEDPRTARLDGRLSRKYRDAEQKRFQEDPTCRVIFCSLKASGVGINLISANRLVLLDPWWNPAAEEQAVDRIYRIGQRRPVEVTRFVIADSIEDKMLEIAQQKREMYDGALAKKSSAELRAIRWETISSLFA